MSLFRHFATISWWLGQQWTRFVPVALLGAVEAGVGLLLRDATTQARRLP